MGHEMFLDMLLAAQKRHIDAISDTTHAEFVQIQSGATLLLDAVAKRSKVFFCGNGGSAASAQHFAAELVGRYVKERGALRSIALSTDTSILTAVGNDYGFENIFSRQIEALGDKGDLLIALTTSGSSTNVLKALGAAKKLGLQTIVLTGQGGANLASIVDVCICAQSTETARIQEVHDFVLHTWCEYIDFNLNTEK